MDETQETPVERARRLGLLPPETPMERARRLGLAGGVAPAHSKLTPAQLIGRATRSVENAQDEEAVAADGTPLTRALGTVTSLSRDIPGAEAAQAGVRALIRRQPYSEALNDIRGAEATAPAYTTIPARVTGATLATMALPRGLSPVGKGIIYGGARGALEADPESLGERAASSAGQALVGGALGRLVTPKAMPPDNPTPLGSLGRRIYPTAKEDAGAVVRTIKGLGTKPPTVPPMESAIESVLHPPSSALTPPRPSSVTDAPNIRQAFNALRASPENRGLPDDALFQQAARPEAKAQFSQLLQKAVDEGAVGETVKGSPMASDPPDNPELMAKIAESLRRAKAESPTPPFRPMGGQSSGRSVAEVLRAKRPRP